MKIHDISWPITKDMTQYKDGKKLRMDIQQSEKHEAIEWLLQLNTHLGTHVDAPAHFVADGKTIDQLPLSDFVGPCKVLDLTKVTEQITTNDLKSFDILKNDIILLKTCNSFRKPTDPFNYSFVYITEEAAQYLVAQDIKAIGIDYLGIEREQPDHPSHKAFMQFDTPIIEGLRLGEVKVGNYFLVCLPLDLIGTDAAPARAVLLEGL